MVEPNQEKLVQEIYCDESGFSGNNLLEEDSPLFSYASVAVSNEEAKELIEKVKIIPERFKLAIKSAFMTVRTTVKTIQDIMRIDEGFDGDNAHLTEEEKRKR